MKDAIRDAWARNNRKYGGVIPAGGGTATYSPLTDFGTVSPFGFVFNNGKADLSVVITCDPAAGAGTAFVLYAGAGLDLSGRAVCSITVTNSDPGKTATVTYVAW